MCGGSEDKGLVVLSMNGSMLLLLLLLLCAHRLPETGNGPSFHSAGGIMDLFSNHISCDQVKLRLYFVGQQPCGRRRLAESVHGGLREVNHMCRKHINLDIQTPTCR